MEKTKQPTWGPGLVLLWNDLHRKHPQECCELAIPNGAKINDPGRIFNTRMDSKTVRAVDFYEGETIDEDALRSIVSGAVDLNTKKHQEKENY